MLDVCDLVSAGKDKENTHSFLVSQTHLFEVPSYLYSLGHCCIIIEFWSYMTEVWLKIDFSVHLFTFHYNFYSLLVWQYEDLRHGWVILSCLVFLTSRAKFWAWRTIVHTGIVCSLLYYFQKTGWMEWNWQSLGFSNSLPLMEYEDGYCVEGNLSPGPILWALNHVRILSPSRQL